jgi:hypothetical protein
VQPAPDNLAFAFILGSFGISLPSRPWQANFANLRFDQLR